MGGVYVTHQQLRHDRLREQLLTSDVGQNEGSLCLPTQEEPSGGGGDPSFHLEKVEKVNHTQSKQKERHNEDKD